VKKLVPVLILIAATAGVIASCRQGDGERCQIQSDCQSGLMCSEAEHRCVSTNAGGEEDANGPEAGPIDAPADAPSDAIDAATD